MLKTVQKFEKNIDPLFLVVKIASIMLKYFSPFCVSWKKHAWLKLKFKKIGLYSTTLFWTFSIFPKKAIILKKHNKPTPEEKVSCSFFKCGYVNRKHQIC